MSFTAITAGLDWQDVDFVNELYQAAAERWYVNYYTTYPWPWGSPSVGSDIQDKAVWTFLQQFVEDHCGEFVDVNATIAGTARGSIAGLNYASLTDLATAAGMSTSGWRRATAWPTDWTNLADPAYSFGQMQAGDIIGPWIFDDLQKAFTAMKWVLWNNNAGADMEARAGYGYEPDCQDARDECESDYNSTAWSSAGSGYKVQRSRFTVGSDYQFDARRERFKPLAQDIVVPAGVNYQWELYVCPNTIGGHTFADLDGLGLSEDAMSAAIETGGPATAATITGSLFGNISTLPLDLSPTWNCPIGSDANEGCEINRYSDVYWLLKWNFQYSN